MRLTARTVLRAARLLNQDRRAVTAIEYALIAALVSVTIGVAVRGLGTTLSLIFNSVSTEL